MADAASVVAPQGRPETARGKLASRTIIAYATCTLAVIAVGVVLRAAQPILLPVAFAFVVSILLKPAAQWFERRGAPEAATAVFLTGAVVLTLFASIYFAGRPAIKWFEELPEIVEEAREKLSGIEGAFLRMSEVTRRVEDLTSPQGDEPAEIAVRETSFARSLTASAQTTFVQVTLTTVLVYFFLATRRNSRRKLIALRRSFVTRLRTARVMTRIEDNIVRYMLTMMAINTGLGLATGAAIAAIGGPTPVVWGVLAAVLNFVPYLGPTALNVLLLVAGLVHYDSLAMAFAPVGAYIALNFIESYFITPSAIGSRMLISPLAIILSIVFFTWLWGPAGSIIAIPLLIVFKTLCDSVEPLRGFGVLLGENVGMQKSFISSAVRIA